MTLPNRPWASAAGARATLRALLAVLVVSSSAAQGQDGAKALNIFQQLLVRPGAAPVPPGTVPTTPGVPGVPGVSGQPGRLRLRGPPVFWATHWPAHLPPPPQPATRPWT